MTGKDKKNFAVLMMSLGEVFSQEANPKKIELYFRSLSDLSIEQLTSSVEHLIRTRVTATFPKPAEIRKSIEGDIEGRAIMALSKLEKAMQRVGVYTSVVFDDPVIHRAIEAVGGWIGICEASHMEWAFKRKEFLRVYQVFAERQSFDKVPALIGIHDMQNKTRCQNPEYFGDKQKALAWQEEEKRGLIGE